MLSSGLPDLVADHEDLARFLTQSNQFNSLMVKPAAFLPNPKYRNTSVFRAQPDSFLLRQIWSDCTPGDRTAKASAVFKAGEVRSVQLEVLSQEPPPRHANIEGWPWVENDPEIQKARQLEIALRLALKAQLIRL